MLHNMFRLARSAAGSFSYYGAAHRIPALYYMDYGFLSVLVAAATATALLLLLLPVLKGRRSTLTMGALMISCAVALGYAHFIPEWQVASARMRDVALSYWPGAPLMDCTLWLGIGLQAANVTLRCDSGSAHPYYNEHLLLDAQGDALLSSLLPPLQTAAIPITGDSGLYLRRAGVWAQVVLWIAMVSWLWAGVMILVLPPSAGSAIRQMGLTILSTPSVYHSLQRPPLATTVLPGASAGLRPAYGASFWLCIAAGSVATLAGTVLDILARRGTVCSTACELDSYEQVAGHIDSVDADQVLSPTSIWRNDLQQSAGPQCVNSPTLKIKQEFIENPTNFCLLHTK